MTHNTCDVGEKERGRRGNWRETKKEFSKGRKKWGRTGTKVNRQSRKEGENSVEKSIPETKAETIATRLQFRRRRRFH